jgi:ornithine--oxo-acid transaminase
MPLDIARVIADNTPTSNALYAENVNPRFAKALKIIGFDRNYVKASGAYMYDDKGRKYLDMLAGYGAFNMGRNHPAIRQVLKDFMDADYCSLVQMETPVLCGVVAAELKKRAGYDLSKVYFCSTGAEGNETAIKFVRRATGRNRIIFASSAFHGLTSGALALNGGEVFREKFGELLDTAKVPFGDLEALERALAAGDVARSSSSRCRARASTLRLTVISPPPASCATSMAHCSWPTRCSAAWAAPASSWHFTTRTVSSRTWSSCRNPCRAVSYQWARC